MAKQSINTDSVSLSANKLRTTNRKINNAFETMEKAAKKLEANWKSPAGSAAHTTMYQLFNNNEARSSVLQNYINMLEQQVTPGYIETEEANKMFSKLADQFK